MGLPRSLVLALGIVLAGARAEAQPPSCVELTLPEQLPMRASWQALLRQETRPLLTDEAGACAQIEVLGGDAADRSLTLQVSWSGVSRVLPLALDDVPEAQRPRAAALLAHGLLQQLLGEPREPAVDATEAAQREPAAGTQPSKPTLPAWDQSPDGPSSASQLTPPRPAPRRAKRTPWDDFQWQPGSDKRDQFQGPARRPGSPWSGAAFSGGGVALMSATALIQLELAAQRRFDLAGMRLGLALLGLFAPSRIFAGGPGARGSLDFHVVQSRYVRLWLGPGFSLAALLLNAYSETSDSSYQVRSARAVAAADVRASLDIAVSRQACLTVALELGYPLRYLRVVSGEEVVLAYQGPLLALRLGVGF
jgi:hypothetical protein